MERIGVREEITRRKQEEAGLVDSLLGRVGGCRSLSALLDSGSSAACQLFGANKALVVLIPEGAKLAYFYSFEDAQVYNFDFEGTFVDSIVASRQSVTFPSEGQLKARSINEEEFDLIRYLPLIRDGQIFGICELCYIRPYTESTSLASLEPTFSEALGGELGRLVLNMQLLFRTINSKVRAADVGRASRGLQRWRRACLETKQGERVKAAKAELAVQEEKVLSRVIRCVCSWKRFGKRMRNVRRRSSSLERKSRRWGRSFWIRLQKMAARFRSLSSCILRGRPSRNSSRPLFSLTAWNRTRSRPVERTLRGRSGPTDCCAEGRSRPRRQRWRA